MGTHIPTPGVDGKTLMSAFPDSNQVFSFLNMFSGGALRRFSVFALGIAPYINSSIIMQLLVYVIPYFEDLAKNQGEEGRKTINQYTRYGTVLIGALQALGISYMLERVGAVPHAGWAFKIMTVITLTAGTSFIMWLGEQMTSRGIGNGISILITAGILAGLPEAVAQQYAVFNGEMMQVLQTILLLVIVYITILLIVFVQDGVRKIPVQYAKRVVGRRVYGGQNTYIPLRVNQAGVIPVIFASSILMFPAMIFNWLRGTQFMEEYLKYDIVDKLLGIFDYNSFSYLIIYVILIIFFTYFYTAITFNIQELADNMKKYGGFIPGIRAGQKTVEFLEKTTSRVTFAGGIFLSVIAVIPNLLIKYMNVNFYFGGTALLIVVGVAMDTMRQLESHLVTRNYEGFMKKSKGLR
jgi:preprotein translocase subunit SecY